MQAQDIQFRVFRVIHSVGPVQYFFCLGDQKLSPCYEGELKQLGARARLSVEGKMNPFTRAVFAFEPQFDIYMNHGSRPARCVKLTDEEQNVFWSGFIEVDQKSEAA